MITANYDRADTSEPPSRRFNCALFIRGPARVAAALGSPATAASANCEASGIRAGDYTLHGVIT